MSTKAWWQFLSLLPFSGRGKGGGLRGWGAQGKGVWGVGWVPIWRGFVNIWNLNLCYCHFHVKPINIKTLILTDTQNSYAFSMVLLLQWVVKLRVCRTMAEICMISMVTMLQLTMSEASIYIHVQRNKQHKHQSSDHHPQQQSPNFSFL